MLQRRYLSTGTYYVSLFLEYRTSIVPWSKVAYVAFEFLYQSSILIVCQITDDGLWQVVYIVPQPRCWPPPRLAMRY